MNSKEAECHNVRTPCGATRAATGAARYTSSIEHKSNVVGTLRAAGVTRCGQNGGI